MELSLDETVLRWVEDWIQNGDPRSYVFFNNLGMDGQDVAYFMEEFALTFNIDMSDFVFTRYVVEKGSIFNLPRILFLRLFKPRNLPFLEFGVEHLIEVAKRKKWFDPGSG